VSALATQTLNQRQPRISFPIESGEAGGTADFVGIMPEQHKSRRLSDDHKREIYTPDLALNRSRKNLGLPMLRVHARGFSKESARSGRFGAKMKKSDSSSQYCSGSQNSYKTGLMGDESYDRYEDALSSHELKQPSGVLRRVVDDESQGK
jgi:hypothetical protein